MAWLIRLYPRAWRDRYGDELVQLVHDLRPGASRVAITVDLVRGAVRAHVQQGFTMRVSDRRAIGRGALLAGILGLGLSIEIVVTNVVFPSRTDNDGIPVLLSYLSVFAVLFLAGLLAARGGAGRTGQVLAGAAAGVVIGVLIIATFIVVDNVWLDVVSQQQTKIDGFARSGAPSMRDYINHGLIGPGVFFTAGFGAVGAALGGIGGLSAGPRGRPARPAGPAGGRHP